MSAVRFNKGDRVVIVEDANFTGQRGVVSIKGRSETYMTVTLDNGGMIGFNVEQMRGESAVERVASLLCDVCFALKDGDACLTCEYRRLKTKERAFIARLSDVDEAIYRMGGRRLDGAWEREWAELSLIDLLAAIG